MEEILALQKVSKIYGQVHALQDINLSVKKRRMDFHNGAIRLR